MHQLQFNARSGLNIPAKWEPMPEGRGIPQDDIKKCLRMIKEYEAAWFHLAGDTPHGLEFRIVKV